MTGGRYEATVPVDDVFASAGSLTNSRTRPERVVYKYPLTQPYQELPLRAGAVFLHVETVDGVPTLWIEQPAEAPSVREEVWSLRVVGTGHPFTPVAGQRHLGSSRCATTGLVWHLYRLDGSPATARSGGAA